MNPLPAFKRRFAHGIHPDELTEQTVHLPIQRVPFVNQYILPLGQHLGAPAKSIVKVGERVQRGQLIAEPGAFVSTALHSPVTGWVRAIEPRRYPGELKPQLIGHPYPRMNLSSMFSKQGLSVWGEPLFQAMSNMSCLMVYTSNI